jgi:selenocysteine-specific elongation factor
VARAQPTLAGDDAARGPDAEARAGALEAERLARSRPSRARGDSALAIALRSASRLGSRARHARSCARARRELRELRSVCEHLVRERKLVRVSSELFFDAAAVASLRERVVAYLKANASIDPAAYKELTGQSRKHTVPLMEYFDAEKLTLRRENVRVLRGA